MINMEGFGSQNAGVAANPKQPSRGEILVNAWERFVAADHELLNAREMCYRLEKEIQAAQMQLKQCEEVWSKMSNELGCLMMEQAPDSVRKVVADQQLRQANQVPQTPGGYSR